MLIIVSAAEAQIKWQNNSGQYSFQTGSKPYFIYFKADWCLWCGQMESTVFTEDEVYSLVNEKFSPVIINVTDKFSFFKIFDKLYSADELAVSQNVDDFPSIIITDNNLIIIDRIKGFIKAEYLINILSKIIEEADGDNK
jgi:thioredoxin-related protein